MRGDVWTGPPWLVMSFVEVGFTDSPFSTSSCPLLFGSGTLAWTVVPARRCARALVGGFPSGVWDAVATELGLRVALASAARGAPDSVVPPWLVALSRATPRP